MSQEPPMTVTSELTALRRAIAELHAGVSSVRDRYGDIPAVRRLLGDVDRILLDAAELDGLAPPPPPDGRPDVHYIDDSDPDPSLWLDADDEGVGGLQREAGR
jgi:hypothetical protein